MNKLLPWLLIAAAPMAMLYPLWANPVSAGEDDVMFFYPSRVMVGQALRAGHWPLTDAIEGTGAPLMADPQTAVLHPATWLFAVLDAPLAYSFSIFIAFSLAGAGAYLYLRTLSLGKPASLFGALAFMFCGFMVGHRVHLSMIMTAAMLGWVLWCIEQAGPRPLRAVLAGAPIIFLAVAAGHWPTLVQMTLVCGAYFLLRARPLLRAGAAGIAAAAIALLAAGPQLVQTIAVMRQSTRTGIGYGTFCENSFFPLSGALEFFPLIFGTRTPNALYGQGWWGPWHLCETLGYVGLVTLVLAGAAVWRMYRKDSQAGKPVPQESRLVRVWMWIAVGAGVWMLGGYLPTYRLVHMMPGLSMVRCPSRMLLAVDMALAALAAVAVSRVLGSRTAGGTPMPQGSMGGTPMPQGAAALVETVQRAATWVLPTAMLGVLALLAGAAWAAGQWLADKPGSMMFFVGWTADAATALRAGNPALWVPLVLAAATVLAVRLWLTAPARRVGILFMLLLADLFTITAFVDVPGAKQNAAEPPAAAWLRQHGGVDGYRIWSLPRDYADRPAELLRPRAGQLFGFATINSYGPLKSPLPSHVFGFGATGETPAWRELLDDNYLLSAYGVKYILAADPEFRRHIESVTLTPVAPGAKPQAELLNDHWQLDRARQEDNRLVLECSKWAPVPEISQAFCEAPLHAGTYLISFDARGPQGGAAHSLRAELAWESEKGGGFCREPMGMTVLAEQIGPEWRHFEATVSSVGVSPMLPDPRQDARATHGRDAYATGDAHTSGQRSLLRLYSMSERPIEVRNISLRGGGPPRAVNWADAPLAAGEAVYRLAAEVRSLQSGRPPVAIYENRLCRSADRIRVVDASEAEVEAFRHRRPAAVRHDDEIAVPRLGAASGGQMSLAAVAGGPAAAVVLWAGAAATAVLRKRRTAKRGLP
ncbi:MAG: hypothetical protein LLG01_11010 [Planctomycetaceae bacterium]|nr:hypothetical protein [Planctomycetaceae bacterium]